MACMPSAHAGEFTANELPTHCINMLRTHPDHCHAGSVSASVSIVYPPLHRPPRFSGQLPAHQSPWLQPPLHPTHPPSPPEAFLAGSLPCTQPTPCPTPCPCPALKVFLANFLLIVVARPLFFGPADDTGFAQRNLAVGQQVGCSGWYTQEKTRDGTAVLEAGGAGL